ncbi:MAG TPA: hypothetical protein PKC72_07920 [Chitinophagaceae bacterium]|nr:hypothetical protein [Chitinophagaceae bacterium]
MENFEINLRNEKTKFYLRLSWLIIIINTILFLYLAFFSGDKSEVKKSFGILILLAASFGLYSYFKNTKYQIGFHPFFFFIMLGWIVMERYWFAGISILFDILSTVSTRKFIVIFSQEDVVYPSFPVKTIPWRKLNNVILKDGLLTIDFKSNKIIQQYVDELKTNVNEKEFNEFCRQQLSK